MRRRIASAGLKVPRSNRINSSNRTQASYNAAENGGYGEGAKFGTFTESRIAAAAYQEIIAQSSRLVQRSSEEVLRLQAAPALLRHAATRSQSMTEVRHGQILDATLRNRTPLTCLANTSPLPHALSGFQEGVIEIVQKRLHAYAYHDLETHMPIEKTITKRPLQSLRTRPNFWAKSSPAERLSAMAVICQTHDDGKPQSRLSRLHYFFGTKVR